MEDLLVEIIDELRKLNVKMDMLVDVIPLSRALYDMDDIHKQIADIGESITGPMGYNLGDINSRLDEVIGAIGSLETVVDLK